MITNPFFACKETGKGVWIYRRILAEEMNVEYATISRIYRGLSVKIEYIYKLSEILNVSTDYLLKGSEGDIELDAVSNRAAYMNF